jgi:hypothetical protein
MLKFFQQPHHFNYLFLLFHLNNIFSYFFIIYLFNLFTKNHLYSLNKDIIVCERWEMGEKNERKKRKKCADHVREKGETKFGEWILIIRIDE